MVSGVTSHFRAINPLTKEALALREAISLASNLGLHRVVFESDSLDLIKACRGDIDKYQIHNILRDIWHLKQNFSICGFMWTLELGTQWRTQLLLWPVGTLLVNWTWSCPEHLRKLIDKDKPRATPNRERERDQTQVASITEIQGSAFIIKLFP